MSLEPITDSTGWPTTPIEDREVREVWKWTSSKEEADKLPGAVLIVRSDPE